MILLVASPALSIQIKNIKILKNNNLQVRIDRDEL
jgi:hypothetical protein